MSTPRRIACLAFLVIALLETIKDPEEKRRQVNEFLRSRKLDLPVLLDAGKEAFSAFHEPGLPAS